MRLPTHDDNYHNALTNVVKMVLIKFTLTMYLLHVILKCLHPPTPLLLSSLPPAALFMFLMYTHTKQSKSNAKGNTGSSVILR